MAFPVERARLRKQTSYTELNATFERRTGLNGFASGVPMSAATGHLLYLIVERNQPATNLMISSLVTYLGANDAGTGFYVLAQDLSLLPRNASAQVKQGPADLTLRDWPRTSGRLSTARIAADMVGCRAVWLRNYRRA